MKARDRERIDQDIRIDALLDSAEGRARLLEDIRAESGRRDIVALLDEALPLDGDIIECGVFRGASVRLLAEAAHRAAPGKTIYACDSYEGFPEGNVTAKDTTLFRSTSRLSEKFRVAGDVPRLLDRYFSAFGFRGQVVKGYFENTLPTLKPYRYCFIHLDCDTYSSHRQCLDLLYDKLSPGGILALDDYHQAKWPGATKAVDEFFAGRPEKPQLSGNREKACWYVRKPAA